MEAFDFISQMVEETLSQSKEGDVIELFPAQSKILTHAGFYDEVRKCYHFEFESFEFEIPESYTFSPDRETLDVFSTLFSRVIDYMEVEKISNALVLKISFE